MAYDRCDPEFEPLLGPFDREMLASYPSTVIGVWRDGRIAYLNAAWDRFAEENGGQPEMRARWDLGASFLDAVAEPLRPFFEDLFRRADAGGSLHPVTHVYECSNSAVYRRMHMTVYGLAADARLIVNSLVAEHPHADGRTGHAPDPAVYTGDRGVIRQCAHCRRVDRPGTADWDWVPAWVDRPPPMTSHGICDTCYAHYYGAEDPGAPVSAPPGDAPGGAR